MLDMDDEIGTDGQPLRFEGPGTYTSANPWFSEANHPVQPATQPGGFADDISAGYRIVMKADFHSAIGPVGLTPIVAWSHDVSGTSPSPILNFVEGRKAVTVSLIANYLNTIRAKIDYTNFFGGKSYNLVRDRDFLAVSASYSF